MKETKNKTVYYQSFKTNSDIEYAKIHKQNINDFEKFHVFRAIQYDTKTVKIDSIRNLCIGIKDKMLSVLEDGNWIVERPKNNYSTIKYNLYNNLAFHQLFSKYNSNGILGCGKGHERFKNL